MKKLNRPLLVFLFLSAVLVTSCIYYANAVRSEGEAYGYVLIKYVDMDTGKQVYQIPQTDVVPLDGNGIGTDIVSIPGVEGYDFNHITVDGTTLEGKSPFKFDVTASNTDSNPLQVVIYYSHSSGSLTVTTYTGTIHSDGTREIFSDTPVVTATTGQVVQTKPAKPPFTQNYLGYSFEENDSIIGKDTSVPVTVGTQSTAVYYWYGPALGTVGNVIVYTSDNELDLSTMKVVNDPATGRDYIGSRGKIGPKFVDSSATVTVTSPHGGVGKPGYKLYCALVGGINERGEPNGALTDFMTPPGKVNSTSFDLSISPGVTDVYYVHFYWVKDGTGDGGGGDDNGDVTLTVKSSNAEYGRINADDENGNSRSAASQYKITKKKVNGKATFTGIDSIPRDDGTLGNPIWSKTSGPDPVSFDFQNSDPQSITITDDTTIVANFEGHSYKKIRFRPYFVDPSKKDAYAANPNDWSNYKTVPAGLYGMSDDSPIMADWSEVFRYEGGGEFLTPELSIFGYNVLSMSAIPTGDGYDGNLTTGIGQTINWTDSDHTNIKVPLVGECNNVAIVISKDTPTDPGNPEKKIDVAFKMKSSGDNPLGGSTLLTSKPKDVSDATGDTEYDPSEDFDYSGGSTTIDDIASTYDFSDLIITDLSGVILSQQSITSLPDHIDYTGTEYHYYIIVDNKPIIPVAPIKFGLSAYSSIGMLEHTSDNPDDSYVNYTGLTEVDTDTYDIDIKITYDYLDGTSATINKHYKNRSILTKYREQIDNSKEAFVTIDMDAECSNGLTDSNTLFAVVQDVKGNGTLSVKVLTPPDGSTYDINTPVDYSGSIKSSVSTDTVSGKWNVYDENHNLIQTEDVSGTGDIDTSGSAVFNTGGTKTIELVGSLKNSTGNGTSQQLIGAGGSGYSVGESVYTWQNGKKYDLVVKSKESLGIYHYYNGWVSPGESKFLSDDEVDDYLKTYSNKDYYVTDKDYIHVRESNFYIYKASGYNDPESRFYHYPGGMESSDGYIVSAADPTKYLYVPASEGYYKWTSTQYKYTLEVQNNSSEVKDSVTINVQDKPVEEPSTGPVGTIKFDPNSCKWTNQGKVSNGAGAYPVRAYYDGDDPAKGVGVATIHHHEEKENPPDEDGNPTAPTVIDYTYKENIGVTFELASITVSGDASATIPGSSGYVDIKKEGYQLKLHGVGEWKDGVAEKPEVKANETVENIKLPPKPDKPTGDSGIYKLDWTDPTCTFSVSGPLFSTDAGATKKPSSSGSGDGLYGKLTLSDNLSGVKQVDYSWTFGNNPDKANYETVYTSPYTENDRSGERIVREIEKPVGDDLYLHVKLVDMAGNETDETFGPFEDPIKLKNFRIIDVTDPDWENIFWKDSSDKLSDPHEKPGLSQPTNKEFKVNELPLDADSNPYKASIKKGYRFYFKLDSEYLYRNYDRIEITPTFYYWDGTKRVQVDAYYNKNNNPFTKVGSKQDTFKINTFASPIAPHGNVELGGYSKLNLTKEVRDFKGRPFYDGWKDEIQYTDGKGQTWYGEYYLPATTIFSAKGKSPRPENVLKRNYIIINFQIKGYKNGEETNSSDQVFTYVPQQWRAENGPKNSTYKDGDVIVYDNKYTALSRFRSVITN